MIPDPLSIGPPHQDDSDVSANSEIAAPVAHTLGYCLQMGREVLGLALAVCLLISLLERLSGAIRGSTFVKFLKAVQISVGMNKLPSIFAYLIILFSNERE